MTEQKTFRALTFQSLSQLLQALAKSLPQYRIYYPARDEKKIDRFVSEIHQAKEDHIAAAVFHNQPVLQPAKTLLVPETEPYLKYQRQGKSLDFTPVNPEHNQTDNSSTVRPQLIMGLKACDLKSFNLLDQVFLEEPEDPRYRERRENTYTVATRCKTKSPYCMCDEFSADRINPQYEGADLILEDDLTLKAATQAGDNILAQLEEHGWKEQTVDHSTKSGNLEIDADSPGIAPVNTAQSPQELMEQLDELFESPIWDELAMRCLNCGVCTYYCPTCHCFDIQDFYRQDKGLRYRRWDSCMFSDFTLMAGGHNPREEKSHRVKNRFFHKLNFFPRVHGAFACVGCGRCIKHCPAGISINSALQQIGGAKVDN